MCRGNLPAGDTYAGRLREIMGKTQNNILKRVKYKPSYLEPLTRLRPTLDLTVLRIFQGQTFSFTKRKSVRSTAAIFFRVMESPERHGNIHIRSRPGTGKRGLALRGLTR
jgi:hypothetical protein